MSEAEIREDVLARDALRRSSGLPHIDVEEEIRKAVREARDAASRKYRQKQYEAHARDRELIRQAIIAEYRATGNSTFPNGWSGHYLLNTLVEMRFAQFLAELQGDSLARSAAALPQDTPAADLGS